MIVLNIITAAYFISLIVMTSWTNIRPIFVNYWNKTEYLMNLKNRSKTEVDNIDVIMAANQVVIAVLGIYYLVVMLVVELFSVDIFGNSLTLVAIPYIRRKYRQEFSILQLNSVTLILHLSLCDLLYAIIGFPHLIHSYLYKTNIYSAEVCYFLGVFRNLVAYTDFNNIALISCCLARQILCKY